MTQSRVVRGALAVSLCILGLSACAPKPPVKPSGYLGDYSEFQPAADGSNALRYVKPGLDLARYHKAIIDPVAVALSADSAGQAVNPAELMALSDYMHDALVIALRGAYPVVEEPAQQVVAGPWLGTREDEGRSVSVASGHERKLGVLSAPGQGA